MNLLALDLGTKTGYAVNDGPTTKVSCGTWTLATPKEITAARKLRLDRRCDPRFLTLLWKLKAVHAHTPLDYILFEDVQFSSTTMQTQLWTAFRSAVWCMTELGIQVDCVPVSTLKKFATGSGAADKEAMAKLLARQSSRFLYRRGFPVIDTLTGNDIDDNAVDAVHLYRWGLQHLRA